MKQPCSTLMQETNYPVLKGIALWQPSILLVSSCSRIKLFANFVNAAAIALWQPYFLILPCSGLFFQSCLPAVEDDTRRNAACFQLLQASAVYFHNKKNPFPPCVSPRQGSAAKEQLLFCAFLCASVCFCALFWKHTS